jgi:RND family efflux transporter MFP subunit
MSVPEQEYTAKTSKGWVIGLIQLVFVIGVIGIAIGLTQVLKGQVNDRAPQIADLRGASEITVRVAETDTVRFTPTIRVNGTVQAAAEVSVSPQVSGEIKFVSPAFRAGADVQKGDLLFEIDRADYILAVQRAESEIAAASSDLQQLEAEAAIAVQEWKELYPGREVNALAARIPQIDAAKARLASAEANKRTSELSLQRTRIYAPTEARVMSSSLDIGQIVSPGQSVGRLVALDSIELAVPVSSEQLALIEPAINRPAQFKLRRANGVEREATVTRIDASLDPRTRLSNLYLSPSENVDLRIGDFVDVTINADAIENAITIPATALSGQSDIWVLQQDRLSARQVVVLGERDGGSTIIVAPFDQADGVVALPPLEAQEGQQVGQRVTEDVVMAGGGQSDAAE